MTIGLPKKRLVPISVLVVLVVAAGLGVTAMVPPPTTLAASVRHCAPALMASGEYLAAESGKIRLAETGSTGVQPVAAARDGHLAYGMQTAETQISYIRCSRNSG